MQSDGLIVFARNPVAGQVKSRLAETIGSDLALEIYLALLRHTRRQIDALHCQVFVYVDEFGDWDLNWRPFQVRIQKGNDLGEKINNAMNEVFKAGMNRVVVIGSDCPGISAGVIAEAFIELNSSDVVIGPAADGGYYLIGLKVPNKFLFRNISWSTSNVLHETLQRLSGRSVSMLQIMVDIDREPDIEKSDWLKRVFELGIGQK